MNIQVHLFGSLREKYHPIGMATLDLPAGGPARLSVVLKDLLIDPEMVQLVMVNHRAVPQDWLVKPGDRVSLFPKDYAVFVDWKDFRMH